MVSIRLKVDLPKGKFSTKGWRDEIARVQRQTSVPRLRKLFQQTVFGWSTKPTFGWTQTRSADEMTILMYPQGEGADIWEMLNEGVPAHPISLRSGFLRFRPGYRASTTPGVLKSRRSYRSGPFVYARRVAHPGIQPRRFTETIMDAYRNPFMAEMQSAIDNIARK